ncbi:Octicosapeptide/Phox/Bem1p family protein [Prunus dulcis]|uniref:Octicosapeptide/Phox/Bem1p family protein n=1 Tax=Prunus dulcis TaxID=3755 RepID=A0A4Y1QQA9_PRUDU|nr:uncharacterized protein LOC117614478 [Prunus dulcis]BBG94026.1 Octicosapeptide/Phox/Bem1p family protein [Prunus dulcis]VVA13325.1 PREDICTED: Phox/Bem1p [Prunus dulcis]
MVRPSPEPTKPSTIKFLCSYGGKILPRYPDGKLRYLGGETRVLAVNRNISFSELLLKLGELCGPSVTVSLRCQLPTEDLDALVSIKSDEDLANLIEEYDRAAASASPPPFANLKIRAFLSLVPPKPHKTPSSTPSSSASASTTSSSGTSSSSNYYYYSAAASGSTPRFPMVSTAVDRCVRQISQATTPFQKSAAKVPHCADICHAHGSPSSRLYLIHNGNHWQ